MWPSLDDLSENIGDLFSTDRLAAAGKGVLSSLKNESGGKVSASQLSAGQSGLASIAAEAKKTQMLESVDPYRIEQQWTERLSTWAKINREQGQ